LLVPTMHAVENSVHRGRPWLVVATVSLSVFVAAFLVPRFVYSHNVFRAMPGKTLTGYTAGRVGQVVDFMVDAENSSPRPFTLRSVGPAARVPTHLRLVHATVLTGSMFSATIGWPPRPPVGGPVYPTRSIAGYQVPAGAHVAVLLSFMADQPGVYIVGPVTFQADVVNVPALPTGSVPVSTTEPQYLALCVQVSLQRCQNAQNRALPSA
jgi:hypothetical protein